MLTDWNTHDIVLNWKCHHCLRPWHCIELEVSSLSRTVGATDLEHSLRSGGRIPGGQEHPGRCLVVEASQPIQLLLLHCSPPHRELATLGLKWHDLGVMKTVIRLLMSFGASDFVKFYLLSHSLALVDAFLQELQYAACMIQELFALFLCTCSVF